MVARPGQCLVWSEIYRGSATWSVSGLWLSLVVARHGQCLVWSLAISRGSATWSVSCLVSGYLSW